MHIEYITVNNRLYARLRASVRKGGTVTHGKSTNLGLVLDKERLIFRNRKNGVFQFDQTTGEFKAPPADFSAKIERKNAREKLIVDFGNVYFIDKYIDRCRLWPVFEAVGYGNPDTFKALLNYYILESRSNVHAKDWYDGSYASVLYPRALMESARISDMLRALGDERVCRRFFAAYIAFLKKETPESSKGCILIDSTGLPNSMRLPITAVSNHNGVVSNEVRLIYVVQRGTGMPIYMRYIPGNVVDMSTLLTTIAELKAMKVDTKFAILDAGYLTTESIAALLDAQISFLARAKKNWTMYKEIAREHVVGLESPQNLQLFNGRFVYLKQIAYEFSSKHKVYCYLGLDDERRSLERKLLAQKAQEEELTPEELQTKMESMGMFMLVSSRRIAVKDLLPLYYTRQDIEQVFDITKGYAKGLPLCVQTVETFRGHLLMVFCSTIVLRLLQRELRSSKFSLDDVLCIMRNQKAKVYDEFIIPAEAVKKQHDLYKLAKITQQISISRPAVAGACNTGSPP